MTTMIEVIDAVKQLTLQEQREVLREIRAAVARQESAEPRASSPLGLPPDFTERLQQLFYQAKLKALQEEPRP